MEIANLFRYARKATPDDAQKATRALEVLLHLQDDRALLQKAIKLAFNEEITVYDSLYVTLALNLEAKLITYDKELLSKFKGVALKAEDYLRANVK